MACGVQHSKEKYKVGCITHRLAPGKQINPERVYTVHTEHPEIFKYFSKTINVVIVERGKKKYTL